MHAPVPPPRKVRENMERESGKATEGVIKKRGKKSDVWVHF
jgi:hypothetical protein